MNNPTFPNNTNEEISILFYNTFGRTKNHPLKFYDASFSLFDFLGIDEVNHETKRASFHNHRRA